MVTIEQWAQEWLREEWQAVPAGEAPGWEIVLKKNATKPASLEGRALGGIIPSEEAAKHIARVHNRWINDLRNVREGREMHDDDSAPADDRAPES